MMGVSNEAKRLLGLDKRHSDPEAQQLENETQQRPWLDSLKGILAALLVVVNYVVSITNLQLLQRRVPDLELQAFRCAGVVTASIAWMFTKREMPTVPFPDVPVVLLHAVLLTLCSTAVYIGYSLVPASAAECTQATSLLLSGLFIFWMCGQERFSFKRAVFVMLCLVGVSLVIQPWHVVPQENNKTVSFWMNDTGDCILQMKKLCSMKNEIVSKLQSAKCRNYTQFKLNETTNLCVTLQTDPAVFEQNKKWQKKCIEWVSCWLLSSDTRNQKAIGNGKTKKNKKIKLLRLQIPDEFGTFTGIVFIVFGDVMHMLATAVFKKYPSVGDKMLRALFWSFLLGFTSSLLFTFFVESPVWPKSTFDTVASIVHSLASACIWLCWGYSLQCISGTTFNIIYSTSVVLLLISQYTILSSILPGQRNWMEVVGVFIVLIGSVLASVEEMFETSRNA